MYNTLLQIIWYLSIVMFFLYKYTSIFLQFKGFIAFSWNCLSWVSWFFRKTFSFISLHRLDKDPSIEPLLPTHNIPTKSNIFTRSFHKIKHFFSFNTKSTTHSYTPLVDISNSHVLSSASDDSQNVWNTGYLPLDKLLHQQSLQDSTELFPLSQLSQYPSQYPSQSPLFTIYEDDDDDDDEHSEPIIVKSYYPN
jgi:hypothetical protein